MDQKKRIARLLGRRLRTLRNESGLTQEDLATYIKSSRRRPLAGQPDEEQPDTINRSAISDYETGRRLPTLRTLIGLAKAFNVDVCELLLDPDESQNHKIALAALKAPKSLLPAVAKLLDVS
jgi:transcriptional regulator with XRE-family HTH domain